MITTAQESPVTLTVEDILARFNPPLSEASAGWIRKAWELAENAHKGQKRKSGEPYFSHCANVAKILAELINDWPAVCAALLHDVIEDCNVSYRDLQAIFPPPIPDLVDGVTKISKINFISDREHQAENLRKMILAMAKDVRVVLIKLCDRLHNMRTLNFLDPVRQKAIATSTVEIFAPLAKRLGIQRLSSEMEDLAMSYVQPIIYGRIADHLQRNNEHYQATIAKMKTMVEASLAKSHIPAGVSGRVKHNYSIYKKMLRQGLTFEEVHDLIAIRIVTENVSHCYEVLGIVHSRWKPIEGKFKDYIGNPKPNGYQSIHTTVIGISGEIIEIQIRTAEMHRLAEEGIAAHWQYKEAGAPKTAAADEAEKLSWLRQLVDWLSDIHDPQEFLAAVKQDVFATSVFIYTPKGDVIEMPRGSTVLDFAFRIHTEVGFRCAGAKLNHKMAPLRTVLKTGDIVEIVTSKSSHPTPDWLQIANSNRAKNKIRHWLKTHDRETYLERGRGMLIEALRQRAPEMGPQEALEKIGHIARQFSVSSADDVLIEIGFGSVRAGAVVSRILPNDPVAAPSRRAAASSFSAADIKKFTGTILVEGMPGAVTRTAQCCSPRPGDAIVGFITQGRGISVHRVDCAAFQRARWTKADAPNRVVTVEWGDGNKPPIQATIRVMCQDRKGLLSDITAMITQLGVNIIAAQTQSNLKTAQAIIKLRVQVPDEGELNMVLKRLEGVPSVRSLRRTIHRGARIAR